MPTENFACGQLPPPPLPTTHHHTLHSPQSSTPHPYLPAASPHALSTAPLLVSILCSNCSYTPFARTVKARVTSVNEQFLLAHCRLSCVPKISFDSSRDPPSMSHTDALPPSLRSPLRFLALLSFHIEEVLFVVLRQASHMIADTDHYYRPG